MRLIRNAVAGITFTLCLSLARPSQAQFTANFQTNTISGVHSNWLGIGGYAVGSNTFKDVLRIISGGVLSNRVGFIGFETKGSNNLAIVADTGSIWSNGDVSVGWLGASNSLIISNGGAVTVADTSNLGANPSSANNVATVTGAGSIWTTLNLLSIGTAGAGNQLVITNGGAVISSGTFFGGTLIGEDVTGIKSTVTVTGTGSVFSVRGLVMGQAGGENTLRIDNGGEVDDSLGAIIMGFEISSSNNTVMVTGAGSVWNIGRELDIGYGSRSNLVTIVGGSLVASNVVIGYSDPSLGSATNNVLQISSGSLFVTNALGNGALVVSRAGGKGNLIINGGSVTVDNLVATNGVNSVITFNGGALTAGAAFIANSQDFVIGASNVTATYVVAAGGINTFNNHLVVRRGALMLNLGTVAVNQLVLTNGANGVVAFGGGELESAGTFVTNTLPFVVGNGATGANFHLLGGVHSFNNGLRISNAATLTGCGTVNGSVTVDSGGSVFTDCGTLTFTGTVTNNYAMAADGDGSVLEFYGTVVNNGGILLYNGGTANFHGPFINNGIISNAGPVLVSSVSRIGDDMAIQSPSTNGFRYELQFTTSVVSPVWTNSGTPQSGTGSTLTFTDPGGATNKPNRFYQVDVIWP